MAKQGLLANGLKHAAGIAVDPRTGALWLLDGRDLGPSCASSRSQGIEGPALQAFSGGV